jgi:hypothetical protein
MKYKSTRREFAKTLAVIAATPLVSAGDTLSVFGTETTQAQTTEQPSPVSDALAEVVRLRYGKNLTEEQLKEVKQSIDQAQRSAERLKQFKLSNSDEPAFIFNADIP